MYMGGSLIRAALLYTPPFHQRKERKTMKYTKTNNVHIIEVPVKDFKIIMNDSKKKSAYPNNYCNAGFFATYHENKQAFTLPVAHLLCDYNATSPHTKKYCTERGKFNGSKFTFDSFNWSYQNPCYKKSISTLLVDDSNAEIKDIAFVPTGYNYAIGGIPIMRSGQDVKFATYVKGQGWDASSLYATWHIFIGLKSKSATTIYVMAMKTTTSNMILTAEAYKKFKALGFYDVIKLDGGGSTHMKTNNKAIVSTLENRRINNIIVFEESKKSTNTTNAGSLVVPNSTNQTSVNPYPVPTVTLKRGNKYKDYNKWLQWQLNYHGFQCDIDGGFGSETEEKVIEFQLSRNLDPDKKVGPATRKALQKK